MKTPVTRIYFCAVAILVGLFFCDAQSGAQQPDFDTEVWPILESRCVECHHANRAEGDLRFDAGRAMVVAGGHTGNPILGNSSTDSELFRRIISEEPGYKMPKEGPPLKTTEVETIKNWLDQGAPWSVVATASPSAPKSSSVFDTAGNALAEFNDRMTDPTFRRLIYLGLAAFVLTLLAAIFKWKRRKAHAELRTLSTERFGNLKSILIIGLCFLIAATWIYYDGKAKRIANQLKITRDQLASYTGDPQVDPLEPPYPMHPKRLGGVYYRGNDERNSELFNGGFYRTARLEVWLVDEAGNHLAWGDQAPAKIFVQFEIHRAANATGELFSDQVMSLIKLTDSFETRHSAPNESTLGRTISMSNIRPGESWQARMPIPIPATNAANDNRSAAEESVGSAGSQSDDVNYQGRYYVVQQTSKPKAHYAIVLDVKIIDGKIDSRSELWMGSLYDLNGRVLIPRDGRVLLDRWFDWRPIPEIEGAPSTDRVLLGLPEHLDGT